MIKDYLYYLGQIEKKQLKPEDYLKNILDNIKKYENDVHGYIEIFKSELNVNEANPLSHLYVALKDNILYKGHFQEASSRILENYVSTYSATVVERLIKNGANIIGRTNMDEFAMGSSTEYSRHGPTNHPFEHSLIPGGSSGGSAAVVAYGGANFALGSDTGGSVRQPAALCGVVGYKPTYGVLSRYGLISFASSLDTIGLIAKSVRDIRYVLNFLKGKDKHDSTSIDIDIGKDIIDLKHIRFGIIKEFKGFGDIYIWDKFFKAVEKIGKKAHIEEVSIKDIERTIAIYEIISMSEASSNLARYDGIRYGKSVKAQELKETYMRTRALFGKEVKRRILMGTYALSSENYRDFYEKGVKARSQFIKEINRAFKKVDILLSPTTPYLPFKKGERLKDPLLMYKADTFTSYANLAYIPSITIPLEGIYAGLQLSAAYKNDNLLLEVADEIQRL